MVEIRDQRQLSPAAPLGNIMTIAFVVELELKPQMDVQFPS